jgi:hypothetical protein
VTGTTKATQNIPFEDHCSISLRTKTNNYFATMSFLDKMKKAGKSVVDAGAKTMLKVSQGHS